MPNISPLLIIDGKSLLALDCEPPKFIVSRLLPVGLSILAGGAKVGKSWLALWLCQQVSKGEPVWKFETLECTVLYLALEDTIDLLHFRLSHITDDGSEDSFFATSSENLSGALIAQLEHFMQEKPDTRLIVIDTLQRIRGSGGGGDKNAYALDYEDMNKIKAIADKLKIAILLIHHVRKMPDSDPFNMVSGSTGIVGSADTIYVLKKEKRTENRATLHVTGRDVEDMQLLLEFDRVRTLWKFISFATGEEKSGEKLLAAIVTFLSAGKAFTGTASELLEELKTLDGTLALQPNALSRSLKENTLTLEKRHNIKLSFSRTKSARTISLSLCDGDNGIICTPCGEKAEIPSPAENRDDIPTL